jgi:hypothetical protein
MNEVLLFLGNTSLSLNWLNIADITYISSPYLITRLILMQLCFISVRVVTNLTVQTHSWGANSYSQNFRKIQPNKILKTKIALQIPTQYNNNLNEPSAVLIEVTLEFSAPTIRL